MKCQTKNEFQGVAEIRRDGTAEVVGGIRPDGKHVSAKRSFDVLEGEALRIESAGGGGYGNPRERHRDLVLQDLRDGYIGDRAAREIYEQDVGDANPQ